MILIGEILHMTLFSVGAPFFKVGFFFYKNEKDALVHLYHLYLLKNFLAKTFLPSKRNIRT